MSSLADKLKAKGLAPPPAPAPQPLDPSLGPALVGMMDKQYKAIKEAAKPPPVQPALVTVPVALAELMTPAVGFAAPVAEPAPAPVDDSFKWDARGKPPKKEPTFGDPPTTKDEALALCTKLFKEYGIYWNGKTPAKAYWQLKAANAFVTEGDKRAVAKKLGLG